MVGGAEGAGARPGSGGGSGAGAGAEAGAGGGISNEIPTPDWFSYVAKSVINIVKEVGEMQSPCLTPIGQLNQSVA